MIREKIHLVARRPAGKWRCNATYGYDSCFSWTKNFAKNNVRLGFPRSVVPYTLTLVATRGAARLDCIPTQCVGTRANIPICRPFRFLKPGRSNRQRTEQVGQQHAPSCLMRKLPVPFGCVQDRYSAGLLLQDVGRNKTIQARGGVSGEFGRCLPEKLPLLGNCSCVA